MKRLDKLDERDWESKMKTVDSAKTVANEVGFKVNEDSGEKTKPSFKAWSKIKDNKGKTFSDYKLEVLDK